MLRKKWLSLLVAISMVAAMFPSTVFAAPAEGDTENTEIVTNAPEEKTPGTEEGTETPDDVTEQDTTNGDEEEVADESKQDANAADDVTQGTDETPAADDDAADPKEPQDEETDSTPAPEAGEGDENGATADGPATTTPNTTTVTPGAPAAPAAPDEPDAQTPSTMSLELEAKKGPTPVNSVEGLKTALQDANDGDTIKLLKGTYDVGTLTITKAVNFQGVDAENTILQGSLYYRLDASESPRSILIQGITLKAQENSTADQALNLQGANTKNVTLNVNGCKIVDFLFGVGVNSGANECIVSFNGVELDNVWCGAGVDTKNGNMLSQFDVTGNAVYEVQLFGGETEGKDKNTYYQTFEDSQSMTNGVEAPSKPNIKDDNWPAVAKIGDDYYGTLEKALAAATGGTSEAPVTITLTDDAELTQKLLINQDYLTLDLAGHTIKAADSYKDTTGQPHLVEVQGNNVTIDGGEGGQLLATAETKHTLNVYGAQNLTLKNVTIDGEQGTGAPLMINGGDAGESASVTLTGNVTFNANNSYSWPYNVNLDKKSGESATLTVAEGANVTFDDEKPGIVVDSDGVTVEINGTLNGGTSQVAVNRFKGVNTVTVTGTTPVQVDGTVAKVGNVSYTDLQAAVDAIDDNGKTGTVELVGDVKLTAPVEVPEGMNLTVEGNGHTITLPESAPYSAFNNTNASTPGEMEGLKGGTTLTVDGVNFVGDVDGTNSGHAVVVGSDGGVTVTLKNCGFTNMYDALYCNNISNGEAQQTTVSITGSTFTNVHYSYSVDDGATDGALTGKHDFTLTGNTNEPQPETFAVAKVGNVGYDTLAEAIANAGEGDTVTLLKDAKLDSMLTIDTKDLTLDLGGNKIYADDSFTDNNTESTNDNHLVDVVADGVTITNGTLEAGKNNNHTLNVWNADGVTVSGVTLDGSAAGMGGAPLIVGGSDVTLDGNVTFKTNENSWYGANVDTAVVNTEKQGSSLTVNGHIAFEGNNQNNVGIWVQDEKEGSGEVALSVTFGENSSAQGNGDPNFEIVHMEDPKDDESQTSTTVGGLDNAGLIPNGNGGFVKPAPAPSKPSTGTSHEHSYVWQGSPDEHWQYCTECGQVVSNGAHTFQWKDGVQVCSVCGYKVTQTSSTSTAPAGSTAAAAAAPAAGTTATAAATGIPQTSDNSNPMLWVVLLALSGSALGGMTIYKKKKEN